MFKVNNRNVRTRCEICSKLTIKTPERRNFIEHFRCLLLTNKKYTNKKYTNEKYTNEKDKNKNFSNEKCTNEKCTNEKYTSEKKYKNSPQTSFKKNEIESATYQIKK